MKDERILALLNARDEQAIRLEQDEYGPLCRHIAASVLDSPEDREECVSDTFLQL